MRYPQSEQQGQKDWDRERLKGFGKLEDAAAESYQADEKDGFNREL